MFRTLAGFKGENDMKKISLILILCLSVWSSCRRESTLPPDPESNISAELYQVGGCQGSLSKTAEQDSIFTYTFNEVLAVDFGLNANCCPDTSRFETAYSVEGNRIVVTVIDTAANLCRCICPYQIHAEFMNLTLEEYWMDVDYNGSSLYSVLVSRP
jgi:hypothetical protein